MGGFHNVRFPDDISYGSSGGPAFLTDIVTMENGAEQRVSRWAKSKNKYTVGYGVRSMEQLSAIRAFWNARKGSAYSFRYKDWSDYTSTSNGTGEANTTNMDQLLGSGNGSIKEFQLVKKYVSGVASQTRPITKPVSGTIKISIDGVNQATGWSIDLLTGVVLFTTAPIEGYEVRAGYEFDVPVRFSNNGEEQLIVTIQELGVGGVDVELVEDFEDTNISDEFWFGGGNEEDITGTSVMIGDINLGEYLGRVVTLDPGIETYGVNCPLTDQLSITGGPFWYIQHRGEAGSLEIKAGGNVIKTLLPGENTTIVMSKNQLEYVWLTIG